MKLVVGLGNPGKKYARTRHNIGFDVLDKYLEKNNIEINKEKFNGLYADFNINEEKVIFLKPQKFMNLSGEVVKKFVDFFKIDINDILVIHDDLDQSLGNIKLKQNSSSGGHNGIKNIELNLGTKNYKRLKIGISKSQNKNIINYVLGKTTIEEQKILDIAIRQATEILNDFFIMDFLSLMNKYN